MAHHCCLLPVLYLGWFVPWQREGYGDRNLWKPSSFGGLLLLFCDVELLYRVWGHLNVLQCMVAYRCSNAVMGFKASSCRLSKFLKYHSETVSGLPKTLPLDISPGQSPDTTLPDISPRTVRRTFSTPLLVGNPLHKLSICLKKLRSSSASWGLGLWVSVLIGKCAPLFSYLAKNSFTNKI